MPNWCYTVYVFHGSEDEMNRLHDFISVAKSEKYFNTLAKISSDSFPEIQKYFKENGLDVKGLDDASDKVKPQMAQKIAEILRSHVSSTGGKLFDELIQNGTSEIFTAAGFGSSWLGYLLMAAGKNWRDFNCRGFIVEMDDMPYAAQGGEYYHFSLSTETAWGDMPEVFRAVLEYLGIESDFSYSAEESGNGYYVNHNAADFNPDFTDEVVFYVEPGPEEINTAETEILREIENDRFTSIDGAINILNELFNREYTELNQFDELIEAYNELREPDGIYVGYTPYEFV